nr:MAG TPA: hypothetical protein [Caudoviricetes sp.]
MYSNDTKRHKTGCERDKPVVKLTNERFTGYYRYSFP